MARRGRRIGGDMPVLFFSVVLGVALTFRVAVGWARAERPPIAPTFVTTAPEPGLALLPTPPATRAAAEVPVVVPLPGRGAPRPRGRRPP
jgi:hypothetical protein